VIERAAGPADPDAYAALEEQRDFLLGSLDDLEREREAGDIDDADYEALRDDYTARAAAVLRALDAGGARFAAARSTGGRRTVAGVVAVVLVLGVGAGILVARSSGTRNDGGGGDASTTVRDQLAQCLGLFSNQEVLEAVQCYDEVLAAEPENVEALTYKGWALIQATLVDDGMGYLAQALEANPDYSPARIFRAFGLQAQGDAEGALAELGRADTSQIPPAFAPLIESLRSELEAEAGAGASPTTSTTEG
jgi:tetratricopeptide (TPR) repeat protein